MRWFAYYFVLLILAAPGALLAPAVLPAPAALAEELRPMPPDFGTPSAVDPNAAFGAAPPGSYTASSSEIASILARLEALEKENEKLKAAPADKKPDDRNPADKKPADGWVDMSTDKWNVRLGGHVQMDYINWANSDGAIPGINYFEFRRLRLLADGTGYGVFDFRLQIDIEPENGDGVATPVTDVKDAYFSMNELPGNHRWRIGNFFVPFSLEQVTNDTNNIFMERSIPTQGIYSADREVGTALYGISDSKNFTWTTGIFFDRISESLKERVDGNQGTRVSGRVTWLPYYDEPSNGRYLVHTGAGILYTHNFDGLYRLRARPQIHEGPFLIDTGNIAAISETTANVELATVWGPLSIQSEIFANNINLAGVGGAQTYGYYVYASYFLTGENRIYERFGQHGAQFARNVPYSNFFWVPGCHSSGAWELKCRTSNLDLSQLGEGQYQDFTAGFNWYWTERTRVMFDWIHPFTTADTPFGATSSDLIAMRFDFNW